MKEKKEVIPISCGDSFFDQVSKVLASDIPRRDALKWIGSASLGIILSTLGVREAEAACSPAGACAPVSCGGTCYCSSTIRSGGPTGRGFCWENQFCSSLIACTSSLECVKTLGIKYRCNETCCGPGHCLPKCGSVPPIGPQRGVRQMTAAG